MATEVKLLKAVDVTRSQDLPAGGFSSWLSSTRYALAEQSAADVPCGECNACCRSSYFIHIAPDEIETLDRIPDEVLFAAPGQPEGNVLMGHDARGHCPMLVDDECSIYEHRPRTCRTYDCRIFAAAGIAAGEDSHDLVSRRSARWQFGHYSEREVLEHSAVQAAARFLREHPECFAGRMGNSSTQLAILAIKVHDIFLKIHHDYAKTGSMPLDAEIVETVMAR